MSRASGKAWRRGWAWPVIGVMGFLCVAAARGGEDGATWKSNWAVRKGFSMSIDTRGYHYPTSIAFVPHPGDDPKDPLYFVTELHGKIKVITNDRSVYTFAEDFFKLDPPEAQKPGKVTELGMAGLCLEEEHGYVFVSFTYQDEEGQIRNNIVRFKCEPGVFSLKPKDQVAFTEIFDEYPGSGSHMIGPMTVHNGYLFVCVGDAEIPSLSQNLHVPNGKILRMTLDGEPVPSNPFYQDDGRRSAIDYIWAYGFRNPFGIEFVHGQLFVTDVGPSVDRFVRVERGVNYGYDGSDWSISSHADIVFAPSVSPVTLEYLPPESDLFAPEYRGKFYVVTSGLQGVKGPSTHGEQAVLMFDYDFQNQRVIGRPHHLLKYRGHGYQTPVSIEFGPDGLYLVPLHPVVSGTSVIFRIQYDPQDEHPYVLNRALTLMRAHGCFGCHRHGPAAPAPPLDRDTLAQRILNRLNSRAYIERSLRLDKLDAEPFSSFREERENVREAEGLKKVRLWIKYRLLEPRFDNPDAQMPDLGLTEKQAEIIAGYLVAAPEDRTLLQWLEYRMSLLFPHPRLRHLAYFFVGGVGIGLLGALVLWGMVWWWKRRGRARQAVTGPGARPSSVAGGTESSSTVTESRTYGS